MKTRMILSAACLIFGLSSFTNAKKPKPVSNAHLLLYGELSELGATPDDVMRILDNERVFVYQGEELYVVFQSDADGMFEFNLPTGHKYELVFGDDLFVKKIIEIDATNCTPKKNGYVLPLDLGLFTPMDGVDYTFMEDPVAKLKYNTDEGDFTVDKKYNTAMSKKLKKIWDEMEDRPTQEYHWIR